MILTCVECGGTYEEFDSSNRLMFTCGCCSCRDDGTPEHCYECIIKYHYFPPPAPGMRFGEKRPLPHGKTTSSGLEKLINTALPYQGPWICPCGIKVFKEDIGPRSGLPACWRCGRVAV